MMTMFSSVSITISFLTGVLLCEGCGTFSSFTGSQKKKKVKTRPLSEILAHNATQKLVDDLMRTYNKDVRPVKNESDVVSVNMAFYIYNILDMDERSQTLSCSTWLTLTWKDEYLQWNPDDYDGLSKLKVSSSDIWLPDIYFYQNAELIYRKFLRDTITKVTSKGDILWAAPVNFKGFCLMKVRYFPFDKQDCKMKFGTWANDGFEVVLKGTGEMSTFIGNGEWDMLDVDEMNNTVYYPDDPHVPYTDVTFTLHFQRRAQFYVFNLIVPACLITLMASLAFLLPPTSQGKINLGTTFMLSKTVFLMIVAESMPPTNEVPVIGQFFATLMVLVSLSLCLNVLIVTVYNKGSTTQTPKPWLRTIMFSVLAPMVFVKAPGTKDILRLKQRNKKVINKKPTSTATYTPLKGYSRFDNEHGTELVLNGNKYGAKYSTSDSSNHDHGVALELKKMNELLTNYKYETRIHKEPPKQGLGPGERDHAKEWHVMAKILDRVFFSLYIFFTVMAVVYLFITVNYPEHDYQ